MTTDMAARPATERVPLKPGAPSEAWANEAFASPAELLSAEGLSSLLGRRVESVDRAPLTPAGISSTDATFEAIEPRLDLCFVAFVACFVPIIVNVNPDAVVGWTERRRRGLRALG